MRISRESVLLALICLLDMVSTAWFFKIGSVQEANPIMRFYLDAGILPFLAIKTLLFVGPIYVLELMRRNRPMFIRNLLRTAIALYLISYGIGVWQVNQSQGVVQAQNAPVSTTHSLTVE